MNKLKNTAHQIDLLLVRLLMSMADLIYKKKISQSIQKYPFTSWTVSSETGIQAIKAVLSLDSTNVGGILFAIS